jgi:hypothetical protein
LCLGLFAALGAGPARAAIEVAITAPLSNTHVGDVGATVPVRIDASADQGIFGVQLLVDGNPYGPLDTTTVDLYRYEVAWNTVGVAVGAHTLTVTATDWSVIGGGIQLTSSPVTVDVGPPYPTIALTSPVPGSSVHGSITILTSQTSAVLPATVAYAVDGTPLASAVWDTTATSDGTHSVSATVTDGRGKTATATATVTVANAPPSAPVPAVTITAPSDYTFATNTTVVSSTVTGGTAPFTGHLLVDGVATALVPDVAGSTLTFQWSTTALAAGSHTLTVGVGDASALTATSPPVHVTVDNAPPVAVMYQPVPGASFDGPTTFQVHASDGYGVKTVQFTVDGAPAGPLMTASDAPGSYLYSRVFDTSTFTAGLHAVSAIVADNAGNITAANPLSITTGPIQKVPVLNYHGITGPLDANPDVYDQTPAQADEELAYLKANGYQSLTVEQYQTWLSTGTLPDGITKPVLITVDDGLTDQLAWDPLLQKYGFTAVLYVVTGFADNNAPGADPVSNMSWQQIQTLAGNGRWQIAFHAGQYGHAEFSDATNTITLGPGQTQRYPAACWTYYTCLGSITTTTGTGATRTSTTAVETAAQFEAQVAAEIQTGIAELRQKVPTASLVSWACPWNDCGQWTTFYNDPGGTVQSWLPGFVASTFPIVFTQTNPVTYALASGTVGALNGEHRRYRFEVHTDTTIVQFAAALSDMAFART